MIYGADKCNQLGRVLLQYAIEQNDKRKNTFCLSIPYQEDFHLSICQCVPTSCLTFLHASPSNFKYNLILTPGRFLHAF